MTRLSRRDGEDTMLHVEGVRGGGLLDGGLIVVGLASWGHGCLGGQVAVVVRKVGEGRKAGRDEERKRRR